MSIEANIELVLIFVIGLLIIAWIPYTIRKIRNSGVSQISKEGVKFLQDGFDRGMAYSQTVDELQLMIFEATANYKVEEVSFKYEISRRGVDVIKTNIRVFKDKMIQVYTDLLEQNTEGFPAENVMADYRRRDMIVYVNAHKVEHRIIEHAETLDWYLNETEETFFFEIRELFEELFRLVVATIDSHHPFDTVTMYQNREAHVNEKDEYIVILKNLMHETRNTVLRMHERIEDELKTKDSIVTRAKTAKNLARRDYSSRADISAKTTDSYLEEADRILRGT